MKNEVIDALLAFLPRLQEHQEDFGKNGIHKNEDDSFFIIVNYNEVVRELNYVLYEYDWVDPSCDWLGQQDMISELGKLSGLAFIEIGG